jgi:hypothetical protein
MAAKGANVKFLLRLSTDLTTKADKTRRRFLRMLVGNLRDAFAARGVRAQVAPGWVRLVVDADDERDKTDLRESPPHGAQDPCGRMRGCGWRVHGSRRGAATGSVRAHSPSVRSSCAPIHPRSR